MSATSLIKYMNKTSGDGRGSLHWGRADIDNAPFRGPTPPIMTEDEAEQRLVRVADPDNRYFDLSEPEQNKAYLAVLDLIANGWGQLIHRQHIQVRIRRVRFEEIDGKRIKLIERDVRIKVYMEWMKFYMEDGQPMHSQRPYLGKLND